ncbi:MAG TPA: hypothetical protein PLN52_07355 [Opitutaceae bacterium]|nr:hypothetical protein [Opitutaceae bacterium]
MPSFVSEFGSDDLMDAFSTPEIEAWTRRVAALPSLVWNETHDSDDDAVIIPHPCLQDILLASQNQPSTPPTRLWTETPFGDDAA